MKRKMIAMMLAAAMTLTSISSSAVVFASEPETTSEAESLAGTETAEGEGGRELPGEEKEALPASGQEEVSAVFEEGAMGLPEGQETQKPEDASEEAEEVEAGQETPQEAGTEAYALSPSFDNAQEITIGQEYSGEISQQSTSQYYKFTLESSGGVELEATARMNYIYYAIYDSEGKEVWKQSYGWDSTSQMSNVEAKLELTKGEYYFAAERNSAYDGTYSFQLSFTSAQESHEETGNGANNTMAAASQIELDREYKGQLALNDDQDWYKFTLAESGRVHIAVNAYIKQSASYKITDAKGKELWSKRPSVNEAGASNISEDLDLIGGDYYLVATRGSSGIDYTGTYTFKLGFESAQESHKETQESMNNTHATASAISLEEQYQGQIAENDDKDYYKFTLGSSGSVSLAATARMRTIYYAVYDSEGKEVWKKSYGWDSTSHTSSVEEKLDLTKGDYYFAAERYKNTYGSENCTGTYAFKLSFASAGESHEETGNGTNNTMAAASQIELDKEYKGQLALNDDQDWYKFTLVESGRVQMAVTAHIKGSVRYKITDAKGKEMWSKTPSVNEAGVSSVSEDLDLTGGDYYFVAPRSNSGTDYTGTYTFKLGFESAQESHKETQESMNNTHATASAISLEEQYQGQIAENDDKDYYKFTLGSSGSVSLAATARMRTIYYAVYDSEGKEVWKKSYGWDSTSHTSSVEEKLDLTKGDYYFAAERYKNTYGSENCTGTYAFKLSFASAGESHEETGNGTNNAMGFASQVELEKQYKGQLALNDGVDFYGFSLPKAGRLQIRANANIPNVRYKLCDSTGKELWSGNVSANDAGVSDLSRNVDLTGGSYYFVAEKNSGTGNYSFQLHLHVYHEVITKATTTADGKIEQKCDCGDIFSTTIIYYPERNDLSEILYTFDGLEKTPAVTVIGSDGNVISESNYTVTYAEGRVNAGTYEVVIEFSGNYSGTVTKTFEIERRLIDEAVVTLAAEEAVYNGEAQEPAVEAVQLQIEDNQVSLQAGVDYTVSYENNENVGTASVVITGIGNYSGSVTKNFEIICCPIENAKITLASTEILYNGKAQKPAVKAVQLQIGGGQVNLQPGTDYTVSYQDNKNIGTAKAVVTGVGNYSGIAGKTFQIKVKKGSVYTVGAYKYKILSSSKVAFAGLKNAKTAKVSIAQKAQIGGKTFKVTEVGAKALYKKTKVTSVAIEAGIETVGVSAFEGCTKLTKVTVGSGVKNIGANAWKGCKKLGTITVKSTKLKSVGKNALKGIKPTAKVKVPAKKLSAYQKLFKNKGQGKKVKIVK